MSNTAPRSENSNSNSQNKLTRGQRLGRTILGGVIGATGWTMTSQVVEAVPSPLDVAQSIVPGPETVTPEAAKTLQHGAFEGIKESADGLIPENYVVYTVKEGDTIDELTTDLPFTNDEARELGEKQLFVQGTPDGESAGQLQIGSKIVMLTEQFPASINTIDQTGGMQNTGRMGDEVAIVQNQLGYQEINLPVGE